MSLRAFLGSWLLCVQALILATAAHAAITCTASVTSISVVYDPNAATQTITTGSYTVSCTRLISDPNTFDWRLGVNDGLQPGGGLNRVQSAGGQRYTYDTWRVPPYTNPNKWGDAGGNRFTGTLNFGASLTASASGPFDMVMDAGQTVQPAGTYNDTITVNLRNSSNTIINTSAFAVTVVTTNACQISAPPGDVSFTYISFQAAAAAASTNYGVRCTTALPYTMALDATSGTLLGLSYTLTIAPSSSGTGTGVTQTYTINGSMPAGQAGTCAAGVCNGSQTRTLTVSW